MQTDVARGRCVSYMHPSPDQYLIYNVAMRAIQSQTSGNSISRVGCERPFHEEWVQEPPLLASALRNPGDKRKEAINNPEKAPLYT